MKIKFILISIIIIVVLTCVQPNEKVTIRVITKNDVKKLELSTNTTQLVFRVGQFTEVQNLKGIEKLRDLKELNIQMGGNYSDYSFLCKLQKLESLIMIVCSIDNLDFINFMPNLKVLVLDSCRLYKNRLDLINNNKLKYCFYNIDYQADKNIGGPLMPFVPEINNIPKSLEYLRIDNSLLMIMSKEFLSKIVIVPNVILRNLNIDYYGKAYNRHDEFEEVYKSYLDNWDFIQSHSNFIIKKAEEVLPKEFTDESLFDNEQVRSADIWSKMDESK
jgi:hypothetical protein